MAATSPREQGIYVEDLCRPTRVRSPSRFSAAVRWSRLCEVMPAKPASRFQLGPAHAGENGRRPNGRPVQRVAAVALRRYKSLRRPDSGCGTGSPREESTALGSSPLSARLILVAPDRDQAREWWRSGRPCSGAPPARRCRRRSGLDQLAQVHHADAVGQVVDHRQVVGDHDDRSSRACPGGASSS